MLKKTVADSTAILSEVMMPLHANHYGSVHGGTILKLVDEAAFVAATKHARKNVVVAYMGRTSMDVEVEIETEKIKQGKILNVGSAYLTMVALDEKGKPAEVPRLILKTKEEIQKNKRIKLKRQERIAHFSRNYK
jgi:acyl-CoA hydrolase